MLQVPNAQHPTVISLWYCR